WTSWGGTISGSGVGQFNKPNGVAVDGSGNVYVADTTNNRIQKLPAGSNTWVVFNVSGQTLIAPNSVATDVDGNVYVIDTGNHRVLKVSSTGTVLNTWGSFGTAVGQFKSPSRVT